MLTYQVSSKKSALPHLSGDLLPFGNSQSAILESTETVQALLHPTHSKSHCLRVRPAAPSRKNMALPVSNTSQRVLWVLEPWSCSWSKSQSRSQPSGHSRHDAEENRFPPFLPVLPAWSTGQPCHVPANQCNNVMALRWVLALREQVSQSVSICDEVGTYVSLLGVQAAIVQLIMHYWQLARRSNTLSRIWPLSWLLAWPHAGETG